MADDSTQRAAHKFFIERLRTLAPFTKEELRQVTGWSTSALDTYWAKQFRGIIEDIGNGTYRVRERFRQHADWRKFRALVTQVKTVPAIYNPTTFDDVVVYEFYMPLTHESALRITLDSLFYKDAVLPRLKRIGVDRLKKYFAGREFPVLRTAQIRQRKLVTPNAICRNENEQPPDVVRTGRWPKKQRRKNELPVRAKNQAKTTRRNRTANRLRAS